MQFVTLGILAGKSRILPLDFPRMHAIDGIHDSNHNQLHDEA